MIMHRGSKRGRSGQPASPGSPLLIGIIAAILGTHSYAQTAPDAGRVARAITAAGVPVVGVVIGDEANKTTWTVQPSTLQAAAQPTIDAFNVNDPAHEQAELDVQVKAELDAQRLTSAVVWTILKQMYPTDTDAQTKTKYNIARARIIMEYIAQPWK